RRVGELDRVADRAPGAVFDHHAALAQLRVGEDVVDPVHGAETDVLTAQLFKPLGQRLLTEGSAEEREHAIALRAFGPLLLDEILAPEVAAQGGPEVSLEGADRDVAVVAGFVDGVARVPASQLHAAALRVLSQYVEQDVV